MREDFYTARIVAMVAAVNSKNHKYDPQKYMTHKLPQRDASPASNATREGMTGEQIMRRFKQIGIPIIDKRTN